MDLSELSPTAKRGEHNIEDEMTFDSNPRYVFHDSRGFEAGRTSELDTVKGFIQHRSTTKSLGEQLHAIWYCIPINDGARPITRAELDFFDECGTGKVPVIILFTKADLLDAQTIGRLVKTGMSLEDAANKAGEESIKNFYKDFGHVLYAKKYPPKTHIYFRDMQDTTTDCSVLVKETAAVLSDDAILQLFLSAQQNSLSLSMEYAVKRLLFDDQGQWGKNAEEEVLATIKNVFTYFPHVYHNDFFNFDFFEFCDDFDAIDELNCIPEHDALHCVNWSSLGDNTTFQRSAFLCIATAIIAEHSYFIWKKQPSKSCEPLKKSFHAFQSSSAFKNVQNAIKGQDKGHTDVAAAIAIIALDNRLPQ